MSSNRDIHRLWIALYERFLITLAENQDAGLSKAVAKELAANLADDAVVLAQRFESNQDYS